MLSRVARGSAHRLWSFGWLVLIALLGLGADPVGAEPPSLGPSVLPEQTDCCLSRPGLLAARRDALAASACDPFRLYWVDEHPAGCRRVALTPADASDPSADRARASLTAGESQSPNKPFWSVAIMGAVVAGALANTLSETPHQGFHFGNEGWFGENSYAGGADKAAHFVQYYIISKEMAFLYEKLGYSRSQSIAIGTGLALLAGIINEAGDGINRYGFSYEDLVMDVSGAAIAAMISGLKANDLVGFRTGGLLPRYGVATAPGEVGGGYSSQIYTADLKLAGVGQRLALNIGPLRYLLFSLTYASKGYGTGNPDLRERQVGVEVGLNSEEILNALGVQRNTWWGYSLHFVLDNFRIPFTSIGFQYDLNAGKWYGPGNGNNYSRR